MFVSDIVSIILLIKLKDNGTLIGGMENRYITNKQASNLIQLPFKSGLCEYSKYKGR